MCDSESNAKWGLPNGMGIDGKLEGICKVVEEVDTVLTLMEFAKTDKARRGLEEQVRTLNGRVVTFVKWVREDLEVSERLLPEQCDMEGESEVLYLLRSCEERLPSKCGREFEMDCDEHETCEFRQRLRNEIGRLEDDGSDV